MIVTDQCQSLGWGRRRHAQWELARTGQRLTSKHCMRAVRNTKSMKLREKSVVVSQVRLRLEFEMLTGAAWLWRLVGGRCAETFAAKEHITVIMKAAWNNQ